MHLRSVKTLLFSGKSGALCPHNVLPVLPFRRSWWYQSSLISRPCWPQCFLGALPLSTWSTGYTGAWCKSYKETECYREPSSAPTPGRTPVLPHLNTKSFSLVTVGIHATYTFPCTLNHFCPSYTTQCTVNSLLDRTG